MSTAQESAILGKIRGRGHWFVAICPIPAGRSRVADPGELFSIIERNSVRLRGWDYPHVEDRSLLRWGPDWVEQDFDRGGSLELWRFHANGLFAHYFAMDCDWKDESRFWPAEPGWQPGQAISYLDTIYSFVEIYELAARLAQSPAGDGRMRVEIRLKNLSGRGLVSMTGEHFRQNDSYAISDAEFSDRWEGSQTELMTRPRELAAESARKLFLRFGLVLSPGVLGKLQDGIGRR